MSRSAATSIPESIRHEADAIIAAFNAGKLKKVPVRYVARYRGRYLHLDRSDDGAKPTPIARLEYTGSMTDWDFAIYLYSTGGYDPEEWSFPGEELVDGTLVGAMRAGLKAYPLM